MLLIVLPLFVAGAIAFLEHRVRHPALRLALAGAAVVTLWIAAPPPMGVLNRYQLPRPEVPPAVCTLGPDVAPEAAWFCTGIQAAIKWHGEGFWEVYPLRATTFLTLLWLAIAPALRGRGPLRDEPEVGRE